MGAVISHLQSGITAITSIVRTLSALNAKYQSLLGRVRAGPFAPVENPTSSYWMRDPPFPEIGDIEGDLPEEADVVIIGSGITGAAAARTVSAPRVVVLEARQLCSGATARNGGHIKCTPHEEFARLRRALGEEKARRIVRMQMRHLEVLERVGEEMPRGEVREVETVDVYLDAEGFERTKRNVEAMKAWMPEFEVRFGVNRHVVGATSYKAGALWPFRLVTSTWHDVMKRYPNLTVSTHTPVSAIAPNSDAASSASLPYEVRTSRGSIRARHVLHATNAYAGHLVPALRRCLTGVIGHMTAQRPGEAFAPVCHGERSWSVIYGTGFDYVTQRPDGDDGSPGELMLGGGLFRSKDEGLDQIGVWDDGRADAFPLMHLRGSMATIFEPKWGAGGELKAAWSGIMGFTGDALPFVGSLPPEMGSGEKSLGGLESGSGQWLAVGFNGEGMVWAWLSGVAVAVMMMGKEHVDLEEAAGRPGGKLAEWYPADEVKVDGARLRRADLTNLAKLTKETAESIESWRHSVPSRMEREDPFLDDGFVLRPSTRITFREPERPARRPSTRLGLLRAAVPLFGGRSSHPPNVLQDSVVERPETALGIREEDEDEAAGVKNPKRRGFFALFGRKRKHRSPSSSPPPQVIFEAPLTLHFLFILLPRTTVEALGINNENSRARYGHFPDVRRTHKRAEVRF
ncbi:hypothetical protein Trco_004537 [Trichoderma cornu-damae]|uniref:FAD dependent oxidoreductase domain-containing protein n=1 Tax=Trichoderma cornu-damae TaxID=654480 RepID=A0A9P8TX11_9HYPO|nr:hypothetical protein Trco_004537 [Trichoderma cornu-damae]